MAKPNWHHTLNDLKAWPLFSWWMNMRILHHKDKRITKLHIQLASKVDELLKLDANGDSGPIVLSKLMALLGKHEAATTCQTLAKRIHQHNRNHPLTESHITEQTVYHAELCSLPPALEAEQRIGYDPETFTLTQEQQP
jgi:hypothetical protein